MNGLGLCAGAAGLELGLSLAVPGLRAVAYVERDAYAVANLVRRMQDECLADAPIWSDLTTFDGREWRGVVDIVTAGYPCQPFSSAGLQQGEDDDRHMWPHVRRIVEQCGAGLVFCENVGGHLGIGFDSVARDLQGMGYRVAATLWTAQECGAPHVRERLFWLAAQGPIPNAVRDGVREFRERRGEQRQQSRAAVAGDDGEARDVAHAHRPGLSEQRRPIPVQDEQSPAERGGQHPDANGGRLDDRYDSPNWWEAEPGMGRVADGVAHRVDRLRLTGNGVVPIVAASAFAELVECGDWRGGLDG